ncbi:MAG: FKBP-type peptidyl-prolyl cis-trans isomerase [Bacteroides sp.]|nr:FKBP-type peptidyl-prolyl cis-trans isomerase [Bacteroides sp.]
METAENKYITVAYDLYTTEDGERELVERATPEHPFQFISGLGTTLDAFESEVKDLNKGDKFEFTIPAAEAYGDYDDDHVLDLPKHIFEVDGRFDTSQIFEGNVVPLMDSEGRRLNGTVVEVKDDVVVMDMNHPLAGEDLTFVGEVVENRPATNEEVQSMIQMMSGQGGCGCGCDSCGTDCGDEGCGDEGCGDEGCGDKGCGCGHDH